MSTKRAFDMLFATAGLLILLPGFAFIAILIRLDSTGPIFFRQSRVGQHSRLFLIYKFRTMVPEAETLGAQVSTGNDPRITRVGRLLRKYKIDELPQLFNVVLGEMSLVGPRPEVPRYVEAFLSDYEDILQVKPGITDFASLEFRNENELLSNAVDPEAMYLKEILPVKIEYYRKYIREQSIITDFKLILRTIWHVV